MRAMRLRIAHQLSLLIGSGVALAVVSVGAFTVWNLHSGFVDYLRQREDEQLMRLVQLVERRAADDPSFNWLRTDEREGMRQLLDEFYGRRYRPSDRPLPPPRPPHAEGRFRPPGMAPWAGGANPIPIDPEGGAPAGRPHPPLNTETASTNGALRDRVVIRDAQRQWVAGRLPPPGATIRTRAIRVGGREVGYMELTAEPEPDGLDLRFLRRQYLGVGGAALGTLLVAVAAGWWVARRWSLPLQALQATSRRVARGERPPRLEPAGALEIAQLTEDVNTMVTELARMEAARRSWIAQVAHELRTPLAVLRGELESIEDGARQPTPDVLANLREEVAQLTRLVDDLHTLSVAEMGGLGCTFRPGDGHATLLAAVLRLAPEIRKAGLVLEHPEASASPLPVVWDQGRMDQVVTNLLTNSLRYTDAPGRIRVHWRTEGEELLFCVEDSEPGVSAADLPHLFDPLFRADRARQRGQHTTHASGLGLAIVRSLVGAHGGRIQAAPSAWGGLCVTVRLPLCAPTPP